MTVPLPTGRFIGLKMWWAYTVTAIRRDPKGYIRAMVWRDWFNFVFPEHLKYRIWNWCFPDNQVPKDKQ